MKASISLLFVLILICIRAHAQNDPSLTVGDTGTITFTYQNSPVTYTTVRAADGLIWLQQNLGSPQIAAYATDTAAYGHYFQWGRWDDGHQLPASPKAPVNNIAPKSPAGISNGVDTFYYDVYNNGNYNQPLGQWWENGTSYDTWSGAPPSDTNGKDPCTELGPDWRLPTQPEFANMIILEGINDSTSAFNSNVKLTLAGQRRFDSLGLRFVDTLFFYWTSTTYDSLGTAIVYAYYNTSVNLNAGVYRAYGASVRCVSECTGVYAPDSLIGPDTVCQGSLQTYSTPGATYASSYLWTFPLGWTVVGPANGSTITVLPGSSSGMVTLRSANSCDTSIAIAKSVFVHPAPQPLISQVGWVLSTGAYTSWQWLLNGAAIPGATSSAYTVTASGSYQVVVTDANGCSDTSAAWPVTLGISGIEPVAEIGIYPNPASTVLNIKAEFVVDASIYTMEGKAVLQQQNADHIDVSQLAPGLYQVVLRKPDGSLLKREKLLLIRR